MGSKIKFLLPYINKFLFTSFLLRMTKLYSMELLAWHLSKKHGKKIGRNNLYKLLRRKGIIPINTTVPYTHYILCGWFKLITHLKNTSAGAVEVTSTKLTEKGFQHFLNIL